MMFNIVRVISYYGIVETMANYNFSCVDLVQDSNLIVKFVTLALGNKLSYTDNNIKCI